MIRALVYPIDGPKRGSCFGINCTVHTWKSFLLSHGARTLGSDSPVSFPVQAVHDSAGPSPSFAETEVLDIQR